MSGSLQDMHLRFWDFSFQDCPIRGQAGERQVSGDVSLALTHNVGATGSTCVVNIYERRN